MKKKFLILTLCFTLIFSSFNYKKSYADGGVISLPMLATVSSLAVGCGIALKNSDDLYDIGRMFYDYVSNHNSMTWDLVQAAFLSSVALSSNNLVSVKGGFLDIVKDFFDNNFSVDNSIAIGSVAGVPYVHDFSSVKNSGSLFGVGSYTLSDYSTGLMIGQLALQKVSSDSKYTSYSASHNGIRFRDNIKFSNSLLSVPLNFFIYYSNVNASYPYSLGYTCVENGILKCVGGLVYLAIDTAIPSIPYSGGYTWDNVEGKKENDTVGLPIPGNLDKLLGQTSDDFWDNSDSLVGNGDLSIPNVSNPSIGVDGSISFPDSVVGNPSIPNAGILSTVKEFIISLVVPSDSFWTDTWGGLYGNFTNSFPMVDMDGFNDLVTGEKKFPNIDINIMGVKGRIVNGDVVNSIVDWLRPIVAGFMMLCLMLFNYRKIYKLIRNSEPFGSVASGNNSDIRSGISEYSKHEVVKATDMVAEYHAWKERGGN